MPEMTFRLPCLNSPVRSPRRSLRVGPDAKKIFRLGTCVVSPSALASAAPLGTTTWQLTLGKRPAGKAIHALCWLGTEQASSALHILILHAQLPADEWAALQAARAGPCPAGWRARSTR